jgi:hypothetical protein
MISRVSKEVLLKDEMFGAQVECLVSNDKLELIEMLVDKLKTMEVAESVVVNLVNNVDEEEKEWMVDCELNGTNCFEKSEVVYTTGE